MIQVVGLDNGNILVANANLFRVFVPSTGEIVDELVSERRSQSLVQLHNEEFPGELAVAIPYDAIKF